jgi:glutamate-1-semialdehyde 2,1-aminomutase
MPQPGWLELIRSLCDEYGIVMIMDEVKTGFRVAAGGAQELFGVQADLVTYAKAMGNGFPIAAIGGRQEVMNSVGPGRTAHGGTYCGNVAGTAAADATLEILAKGEALETVATRGRALMEGLGRILADAGIPHHFLGVPAMFGIAFSEEEPVDYRSWAEGDTDLYEAIMMELVHNGAMPDPDGREPWFLCAALSEQDVADTLSYFDDAVKAVKS